MEYDIEKLSKTKNLSEIEQQVFAYILQNLNKCSDLGVRGLARENYTSTTTIIRLAKKLGYDGFVNMVYDLKEKFNQKKSTNTDTFGGVDINNLLVNNNSQLNLKQAVNVLLEEKSIYVYGTGFSKVVGEYFYRKLLTIGKMSMFSTGSDGMPLFNNNIHNINTLLLISKSGETDTIIERANIAKEKGLKIISFTGNGESILSQMSDIAFIVRDENVIDDSNYYPNLFFAHCISIFEYIIKLYYDKLNEKLS